MNQANAPYLLIVYYSANGSCAALAKELHAAAGKRIRACGALPNQSEGFAVRLRQLPRVSANIEAADPPVPDTGPPYCTQEDLAQCAGLLLGTPTRFGNMAASVKYFLDSSVNAWVNGDLIDKPFGLFTSSSSMHGGQESTLLSSAIPLLHHGMIYVGIPYSEEALNTTTTGGTPYGASHLASEAAGSTLSAEEKTIATTLADRIVDILYRLHGSNDRSKT